MRQKVNEEEVWKDVGVFPGYVISNLGRVMNKKTGRVHKGNEINGGYIQVQLGGRKRKMFLVHRLVAMAFIPNPHNHPEVNHEDGDKKNNTVSNLTWCTHKENIRHAFRTGLHDNRNTSGERNGNAKLLDVQRQHILSDNRTLTEIAKDYGVTIQCIAYVKKHTKRCS